jgi:hypothetical protein
MRKWWKRRSTRTRRCFLSQTKPQGVVTDTRTHERERGKGVRVRGGLLLLRDGEQHAPRANHHTLRRLKGKRVFFGRQARFVFSSKKTYTRNRLLYTQGTGEYRVHCRASHLQWGPRTSARMHRRGHMVIQHCRVDVHGELVEHCIRIQGAEPPWRVSTPRYILSWFL